MMQPRCSLKSPLRYPGGKSRAVKTIMELLPQDLHRLCSPFIGGGSIELACAANGVKVFGYDLFMPLVNFWHELFADRKRLVKRVKVLHPMTRTKFYELQKSYEGIENSTEQAAVFFALNRASFSGTTLSGGMSPGHPRFTPSSIDSLRNFECDSMRIERADFHESLQKHANDFLYLDPPYANGQVLYGTSGDCHAGFDHGGLAEILRGRDGWILSYNDCKEVRLWYKGHKFLTPSWTYGMNNNRAQSNEVLVLSRDIVRSS